MLTTFIDGDQMPYLERLRNFTYYLLDWLGGRQLSNKIDRLYRSKYGKDFPSVRDLVSNISLAFVHANPFFDLPRPISHKTIYVGGVVEKDPKPLSLVSSKLTKRACKIFRKSKISTVYQTRELFFSRSGPLLT